MGKKTKITIDYNLCGDGDGIDPRDCAKCLKVCTPAIFLLHETFGAQEENPFDPQIWRVTPVYLSLCTKCMKCVEVCSVKAITVI